MSLQPSWFLSYHLFLLSNGVFQFLSSLLWLFFKFSTSQGSLVSLIGRRSNLVLPLLFLFRFSPVPSYISGRDPLVVVECCNTPRPTLQKTSNYSEFRRVICFVCCIFCIASCHHVINFITLLNKLYGFFDPFKSREFTCDFSL